MNDEWDITRGYLNDLVEQATARLRDTATALRAEFAGLEAERASSRALLDALHAAHLANPILTQPIWREFEQSFQRRCLTFLSNAANLDVRIRRTKARSRAKSIDHTQDHAIAFSARLRCMLNGETLRSAILTAASERGVAFAGPGSDAEYEALYRRIKRLTEDRRENIETGVLMALRTALRDK